MDKSKTQDEFKQAQADLHRLRKDKQLPPLMQLKLTYLQALLTDSPSQHDIGQLLEVYQRQAISDLPVQTKKRLFVDTIRCLSGRQVITYFRNERAYIRTQSKLFSWQKCYLNCNTNVLSLLHKRESKDAFFQFQLQRVCISKNYKKFKNKHVLAIDFEGIKHIIGLDQEITCKRIHRTLGQLIDQKKQCQTTLYDNHRFIQEREAERLALPSHRVQKIMFQEQYQHLISLQQRVKEFELFDQSEFQLYKSSFEGRVLINKNGVVKTQVIIKGFNAFAAASGYIQMTSWNKAIQKCDIVGRPRTNCLIANFKTKKYSMISYPREANLGMSFFKTCNCHSQALESKYYLLIESLEGNQSPSGNMTLNLKQILSFVPNKQDPNLLLVISYTKADFKGFCSQSDNLAMTLHIIQQIEQYCQFMHATKAEIDKFFHYFQPVACPCGLAQDNDDVSLPTERQELFTQQNRGSINTIILPLQFKQRTIIAAMEDICRGLVNEQIQEIIISRSFENYYLKHHFSSKDQSIKVFQGGIRNFLGEGTKWKLQKQELIFINAQVLAVQKDILKMVLKQISACIIQGKSVMNMSLPVQIFDQRSLLDVIADNYGFLPAYSQRIAKADPVQQIKLMTAVAMFGHATNPNIEKPFNPILGETYQGRLGDFQVYLEQTSHHPPVSSVLIKNKDMEIYGNLEVVIGMGLNCAIMQMTDWFTCKVYSTGTEYLVKATELQLGGLVYGPRTYRMVNKGYIFEKKNSLFCEFSVAKDKKRVYEVKRKLKSSDITGGIFKVNKQFYNHILSCKKLSSFDGIKAENIVETCCLISGKWYGDLYFNGVCYKSLKDGPFPVRSEKMKYVLPSDSIWRQDIIHRIWKNYQRSNREKQKLENLQRNDRKLRQKYKKHK